MQAASVIERRRHPRYATKIPARLLLGEGLHRRCEIRDYCLGGLLVRFAPAPSAPASALEIGKAVELITILLAPGGPQEVRLAARVVWLQDDCVGLEFPELDSSSLGKLQRHDELKGDNAARDGDGSGTANAGYVGKLRHVAQGILPIALDDLLGQVSTGLLDRAAAVKSNREQQQLYEDMSALEALRRERGETLTRRLLDFALAPDAGNAKTLEARGEGGQLELVDTDDFERWLEASKVAARLDDSFATELQDIEARLAARRGTASDAAVAVPFNPHQFTEFLKELATELDLAAPSRQVLFSEAEKTLGQYLGGLYAELRGALDSVGMLPPSGEEVRSKAVGPGPHDGSRQLTPSPEKGEGGSAATEPAAPTPELQREPSEQRAALAQQLVDQVIRSPEVSPSLAGWLKHLEPAMSHEAAANEGFFLDRSHPLREIIDRLGHLQMFRAHSQRDLADDPIHRGVAALLQPIVSGKADAARYEEVAGEVGKFLDTVSRQYQRNVERVVAAQVGRDRMRRARNEVTEELNRRYAGKQVPSIVPELLAFGWRALLELALLRAGATGEEYVRRLDLLDALVALLGGEAYAADASAVNAEAILEALHADLEVTSFDPLRRHEIETRLRTALNEPARAADSLARMAELAREEPEVGAPPAPEGVGGKTWQTLLARAGRLGVGDLVRLENDTGGPEQLRVAWIRDDRELFTLVNHRGLHARDLSLAELAEGLHRRELEIEPADGRALSERAVDAMLARMEETLAYQAAHDSLTGLLNRLQFQAQLETKLAEIRRESSSGVLLWLDIDQFRLVNEIHGYDVGDRLLIAVARLLEDRFDPEVVLGHLGGDRFGVLVPGLDGPAGDRRANAACGWIAGLRVEAEGRSISLTASIGVVDLGSVAQDAKQVLQAAETTAAAAKSAGGNQAYRYSSEDPEIVRRQESVHWVAQVDDALDRGRLRLRCQPIVPVQPGSGLTPHYEVLLGVEDGQGRSLAIGEFIAAAEAYRRMQAVDRWITRTVIEWVAAHREQMPKLHGFSVNLSGQTAGDPGFVEFVRSQFRRHSVAPEWISFEITETAAISDLSQTAAIIRELRTMGCKVALDDFGSGLASYSYLKELPVDWLKIDGVFVRNIATDADDYAVVKSINEIGHFLGKKTIAEYVVDERVLAKVGEMGVDFAQGFGVAPPCLLDDLVDPAKDQPWRLRCAG